MVTKIKSFLNIIIMKDMDDDDDDSKSSGSESKSEEEEEEEDGEDGGSSLSVFDPKASHSSWTYNKKTKFMTCSSSSWNACISKKATTKFTVELGTGCGSHMMGLIEKKVDSNKTILAIITMDSFGIQTQIVCMVLEIK